ncbi:MAG: hypothetical protein AAB229_01450 [Candidatus Hydrogenedentota bacterium]
MVSLGHRSRLAFSRAALLLLALSLMAGLLPQSCEAAETSACGTSDDGSCCCKSAAESNSGASQWQATCDFSMMPCSPSDPLDHSVAGSIETSRGAMVAVAATSVTSHPVEHLAPTVASQSPPRQTLPLFLINRAFLI